MMNEREKKKKREQGNHFLELVDITSSSLVGMMLQREPFVGVVDILESSVGSNTQDLIVICHLCRGHGEEKRERSCVQSSLARK